MSNPTNTEGINDVCTNVSLTGVWGVFLGSGSS